MPGFERSRGSAIARTHIFPCQPGITRSSQTRGSAIARNHITPYQVKTLRSEETQIPQILRFPLITFLHTVSMLSRWSSLLLLRQDLDWRLEDDVDRSMVDNGLTLEPPEWSKLYTGRKKPLPHCTLHTEKLHTVQCTLDLLYTGRKSRTN